MFCSLRQKVKYFAKRLANAAMRFRMNLRANIWVGQKSKVLYCNVGNNVSIGEYSDVTKSQIGRYTYISESCKLPFTKIGAFCSIASNTILAAGNHPSNYVSTSPATFNRSFPIGSSLTQVKTYKEEHSYVDVTKKFYCEIGNDVWIATRATLVCGKTALKIGDGAIIRSGAVVTHDVPPYAIVQGVPATIVGYRFASDTIEQLLQSPWWNKDDVWLRNYVQHFTEIDVFLEKMKAIRQDA